MLFNSYIFILFFLPITYTLYFFFNARKRYYLAQFCIIIASFLFYGYYNWSYLLLMIGSIILNYVVSIMAHLLKKAQGKLYRGIDAGRFVIFIGILLNISILFYFKYKNFFVENINILFHKNFHISHIVLPLGISFYTFQQISFLIDTYNENIIYEFCDYVEFVCFFPQLVAGPIVSHDLIKQFRDKDRRKLNYDSVARGLFLFSAGLFKKIIVADTFAKAVDWGFANIAIMSSMDAIIVMVAYSFQIYFDFSGYADMAVGLASMINIDIPCNFNAPYQADSIVEFWKRWHITLTNFLSKYVYYPLGGSKKGKLRTYFNIFIVFLVSGIWHGANWTFVIWGMIHGIANICNRIFNKQWNRLCIGIRRGGTFIFLCFTWMIFRADSLKQSVDFAFRLVTNHTFRIALDLAKCFVLPEMELFEYLLGIHGIGAINYIIMSLSILCVGVIVFNVRPLAQKEFQPRVINIIGTVICMVWSVLSLADNSPFIYFGF